MRVAVDARLVSYQPAGIGNYVLSLLRAMRPMVDPRCVTVLISRRDRTIADALPEFRTRRALTPPHHRFEQVLLAAEAALLPVDLYHAPDFIPPLVRRFPAVATVHDLAFLRMPELLTPDSRAYYGQIGHAVSSAQRIIAVSDCTRRDLVELVGAPAKRIDVVYEAADERFHPPTEDDVRRARLRHGLPDEYFLFVGTREPRKNLRRLLLAYAAVADRPGAPHFAIVGRKGWLSDDLEPTAASLGVADRVHWLGGLPSEELVPLYGGALALALPSLYEGFGLPALEAMACGAPVVASTGGSLPEIVGDAGLLVDPLDVDALRTALERVWREPELRVELRGRGFERVGRFSWRRAAAETLDVYRRAA